MASQDVKDLLARMVSHPAIKTETAVYTPSGGKARDITVLVDRPGSDSMGGPTTPAFTVTALNDRLDGIPAAEINRGGDVIEIDEKFGNGNKLDRTINATRFQDPDWITVEVG